MKKILASFVAGALLASTTSALAQGTVTFSNSATSLVRIGFLGGDPVPVGTTSGFGGLLVGLFWGVTGSTQDQLVQIGATATINPQPGRYSGGTRTTGAGTTPGASAVFQVRAWSADLGADWATAANAAGATGWIGVSATFTSATGGAGSPPSTPVNLNATVPGFAVGVPEPSVVALAVLGAGALLFRRRKA